jgi:Sperm-tail PG-rich repeat
MDQSYKKLPTHSYSKSAILRGKSYAWSFPKATRFLSISDTSDVPLLQLPSMLDTRSTTMGKGKRHEFALNDNPSPSLYNSYSQFNPLQRKPGIVFGPIPLKKDQKSGQGPGPGSYTLNRSFISQSKGVKMKFRKVLNNISLENPAPNYYNISEKSVKQNRYSGISIGRGKRHDFFDKHAHEIPGPGSYTIPSKFDNFSTPIIRAKLNLSSLKKSDDSYYTK